jgi:hypothetical protein
MELLEEEEEEEEVLPVEENSDPLRKRLKMASFCRRKKLVPPPRCETL